MSNYSIGYWANTKRWTQTHINESGKPVCGSQIGKDLRFQWCCYGYSEFDYIECEHCKNWYRKKLSEVVKRVGKKKYEKHAKGRRV